MHTYGNSTEVPYWVLLCDSDLLCRGESRQALQTALSVGKSSFSDVETDRICVSQGFLNSQVQDDLASSGERGQCNVLWGYRERCVPSQPHKPNSCHHCSLSFYSNPADGSSVASLTGASVLALAAILNVAQKVGIGSLQLWLWR